MTNVFNERARYPDRTRNSTSFILITIEPTSVRKSRPNRVQISFPSSFLLVKYPTAIDLEALHRLAEVLLPTVARVAHLSLAFPIGIEKNAAVGVPSTVPFEQLTFAVLEASGAVLVATAVPDLFVQGQNPAIDDGHGRQSEDGEDGLHD